MSNGISNTTSESTFIAAFFQTVWAAAGLCGTIIVSCLCYSIVRWRFGRRQSKRNVGRTWDRKDEVFKFLKTTIYIRGRGGKKLTLVIF